MRTKKQIIDDYNDYVDNAGDGMTGNIKIMLMSSRIMIELLMDIRETLNKVPESA